MVGNGQGRLTNGGDESSVKSIVTESIKDTGLANSTVSDQEELEKHVVSGNNHRTCLFK